MKGCQVIFTREGGVLHLRNESVKKGDSLIKEMLNLS